MQYKNFRQARVACEPPNGEDVKNIFVTRNLIHDFAASKMPGYFNLPRQP